MRPLGPRAKNGPGPAPRPLETSGAGPGDPFEILGVAWDADEAAVRSAYRRAVREHPPEGDAAGFERVRQAYERVRDPAGLARSLLDAPVPEFPAPRDPPTPPPPDVAAEARQLLRWLLATGVLRLEDDGGA